MRLAPLLIFASLLFVFFFSSCKKNKLLTDNNAKIQFSADTLTFDTVFTTIGSATRQFKIYNPYSQKIKISRIWLENGKSSAFRINVDGMPGTEFTDLELAPHDSTYIFVAVTVDPNNTNNPMVIYGNIFFLMNGNQQQVTLQAWGQDAYFHYNQDITTNTIWKNDKPHVILGIGVFVDSLQTLTINAGAKIYCHAYSHLFVQGGLQCNGTGTDTIVFQGDRLERYYDDLPGQWGGIVFLRGALPSQMTHTVITEGEFGIIMGSVLAQNYQSSNFDGTNAPQLWMKKSVVKHCSQDGVFTFFSGIQMDNCLVYDCGDHCAQFAFGGDTKLNNCTFANFANSNNDHQSPTVRFNNYFLINNTTVDFRPGDVSATNCIVEGGLSSQKELVPDDSMNTPTQYPFTYSFTNCLLRTHYTLSGNTHFVNCIRNTDPLFTDKDKGYYSLKSGSPAINAGIAISGITSDITDKPRDSQPDLGAYEF